MLGAALVAVVSGILGVFSLFLTDTSPIGLSIPERVEFHSLLETSWSMKIVLSIILAAAIVGICVVLVRRAGRVSEPAFVTVLSAAALAMSLLWVWLAASDEVTFVDAQTVTDAARTLAAGDLSMFQPHSELFSQKLTGDAYLSYFPHQSGVILAFMAVAKVVSPANIVPAIQAMNAVAGVVTGLLLWDVARACGRPKGERLAVAFLALTFVPSMLFSVFTYGNLIGFALAVGAADCLVRAMGRTVAGGSGEAPGDAGSGSGDDGDGPTCRIVADAEGNHPSEPGHSAGAVHGGGKAGHPSSRIPWALAASALMLACLWVKPTFSVVVGAMVIALLIHLARTRDAAPAVAALSSLAVAYVVASAAPPAIMSRVIGWDVPKSETKAGWVVMGLSTGTEGIPGWFSPFPMSNRVDGDRMKPDGEQTADAMEAMRGKVSEMGSDPAHAVWFMQTKIQSMWLDPTYQCLWISAQSEMSPEVRNDPSGIRGTRKDNGWFEPTDKGYPHGWLTAGLLLWMDASQSALYLAAAVGAASLAARATRARKAARQAAAVGTRSPTQAGGEDGWAMHRTATIPPVAEFLLPCAFFLGFCLYLVWEAKGQYAMPFAMCLVPLAGTGCAWLAGLRKKGAGARETVPVQVKR